MSIAPPFLGETISDGFDRYGQLTAFLL
jgi:hypothetical protein